MITRDQLQGHWRRNWLRAPGFEDHTTRVTWVQAGPWCADLRVPLIRPERNAATSLADMTAADLAVLLSAEGFAGRITLEGDVCTWERHWNWRGFPCPVDAGVLWFDQSGHLIEDGVHADYREEWQFVAGPPWQAWAVKTAGALETAGADGVLLNHDTGFVLGLGQRSAPSWSALMQDLRDGTASAAEAAPAFASVYVMGHWADGQGIADLSTQPFCEGRVVLRRSGLHAAELVLPDFHGRDVSHALVLTRLAPD